MEAARIVKKAGGKALRGGVVKYRSSPYSRWEGIGSSSEEAFRTGLKPIVKDGRQFALPAVVEVLDPGDVSLYEDLGIDCLQIGEPKAENRALPNRMRDTPLPVIHKRGNSLDLAGVMAGASVMLVEVHPNPLIAKSDGFQGPFPEQVKHLVTAREEVWETRKRIEPRYVPSVLLERDYEDRVAEDKKRFFGAL